MTVELPDDLVDLVVYRLDEDAIDDPDPDGIHAGEMPMLAARILDQRDSLDTKLAAALALTERQAKEIDGMHAVVIAAEQEVDDYAPLHADDRARHRLAVAVDAYRKAVKS